MFRSTARNSIVPQSEHLRLSGAIALHWGNDQFDRPAFDFTSFVAGVALHDWGHGFFDRNDIAAMSDPQRHTSLGRLASVTLSDPIAETVMLHHVLRLSGDEALYDDIRPKLQAAINANIRATGITQAQYLWADRITMLADMISYDFSFGGERERTLRVYTRQNSRSFTNVHYRLREDGALFVDPWPFGVSSIRGLVLSYEPNDYPEQLRPTVLQYHIQPKSTDNG